MSFLSQVKELLEHSIKDSNTGEVSTPLITVRPRTVSDPPSGVLPGPVPRLTCES